MIGIKILDRAKCLLNLPKSQLMRIILEKEFAEVPVEVLSATLKELEPEAEIRKRARPNSLITQEDKRKSFDMSRFGKRHVLLRFGYIGREYSGVALQNVTANTVLEKVLEALEKTCLIEKGANGRQESNLVLCGRTDKGVSAFGNAISVHLRSAVIPPSSGEEELDYPFLLNKVLPDDIRITGWAPCPLNDGSFSARFDCAQRTYKYLFWRENLDIKRIKDAADRLIGEHDFRNFCKIDITNCRNFVRIISSIEIESIDKDLCIFTIKGTAFLYHQIRCIVSILFSIGQGLESPELIDQLLDVKANPGKPNYEFASDVPLILWKSEFSNVTFSLSEKARQRLYSHLSLNFRNQHMLSMLWRLWLGQFDNDSSLNSNPQNLFQLKLLSSGSQKSKYVPIMNRPKGPSVETLLLRAGNQV